MTTIRRFPTKRSASSGATWRDKLTIRLHAVLGRLANKLGLPGMIAELDHLDVVTGRRLTVRIGELFTCLTIDGRDYYFRRWVGTLDGNGTGCA